MITYVFGKTGSGKSYKMVSLMVQDLENNKKVYSTIELNSHIDNYNFLDSNKLREWFINIESIYIETQEDILEEEVIYSKIREFGIYDCSIFIDEAHIYGFNDRGRVAFLMFFFALQRHINIDIYLGTQTPKQLNSLFHDLGDSIITCISPTERLMSNMLEYRYFSDVSLIRNSSNAYRNEKVLPKKEIFELYTSGANNKGDGGFRKKLKFILIGMIIVSIFVLYQFSKLLSPDSYGNNLKDKNSTKEKNINPNKEIDKNLIKKKEIILIEKKELNSTKKKDFYINSSNPKYLVVSCSSYCSLFGYLIPKREFNKYFFSLPKKPIYKKYLDFYLVKVLRKDVINFLNQKNYSSFSPLYSFIDWNK